MHKSASEEATSGQTASLDVLLHMLRNGENIILISYFHDMS